MKVGVIGAGIGGLAASIGLSQCGCEVTVFEQAARLTAVGSGINLGPNAVRALDGLGLGNNLRSAAYCPPYRVSRHWDDGEISAKGDLDAGDMSRYGAPMLLMHRSVLLDVLVTKLANSSVRIALGQRLVSLQQNDETVRLTFASGHIEDVDLLVGADGIHSTVRGMIYGNAGVEYAGRVAYRAFASAEGLPERIVSPLVKWWGAPQGLRLVTYRTSADTLYIFGNSPAPESEESWSSRGSIKELREVFDGFHEDALKVLHVYDGILKTGLYVRPPLENWVTERVALLGDACHPMLPFMGQGAAMAIEDAVILARSISNCRMDGIEASLLGYQQTRYGRATAVQAASNEDRFFEDSDVGADEVYGYDVWSAEVKN